MKTEMDNMDDEIAKMKAEAMPPPPTEEEHKAALAYLNSLDYTIKPANCTDNEWAAIQRYYKTGVPDFGNYEELDFNNVGGTLSNQEGEKAQESDK
jgi:hypothetical protein